MDDNVCARALDFLAMPISSLSHCRMLLIPNTIRHFAARAMDHTHHKHRMPAHYTGLWTTSSSKAIRFRADCGEVAVTPPHDPDFATQTRFDNIDHDWTIDTGMMRNDTREQGDANPGCDESQDGLTILAFERRSGVQIPLDDRLP